MGLIFFGIGYLALVLVWVAWGYVSGPGDVRNLAATTSFGIGAVSAIISTLSFAIATGLSDRNCGAARGAALGFATPILTVLLFYGYYRLVGGASLEMAMLLSALVAAISSRANSRVVV
jgi:hypothetical protein